MLDIDRQAGMQVCSDLSYHIASRISGAQKLQIRSALPHKGSKRQGQFNLSLGITREDVRHGLFVEWGWTSAGSINAVLFAAEFRKTESLNILNKLDLKELKDTLGECCGIWSV